MAEIFLLPKIGDAMVEAEIVKWYVAEGDQIELDQLVCSVETDKSVVELSSPFRGTVLALGGEPGDVIAVGEPLFAIGAAGESLPAQMSAVTSAGTAAAAVAGVAAAASVALSAREMAATGVPAAEAATGANVISSPLVRRLAADNDVDLASIAGSGNGGRVTRADVLQAIEARSTAVTAHRPDSAPDIGSSCASGTVRAMPKVRKAARDAGIDLAQVRGSGRDGAVTLADLTAVADGLSGAQPSAAREHRERLSATRRSIAAHLTESARTIPQFTAMVDVDASGLLATRAALRDRLESPVPLDAVFVTLLIPVLRDHPVINARLDGDEAVFFDRYDIGVAVDTPSGLLVPVVRDADLHTAASLAQEIDRLAVAARERTISPGELADPTCTVNNVGAVGIEAGTPMLPVGTSTIVAFGAARPQVRLNNGNPVEVPVMTISATFDHRLIDGGTSGRFLSQLRKHLEVPALGLL